MTTVAILTSTYPFPPGEQFLETEMESWRSSSHSVLILPLTCKGSPRPLPTNVTLDLTAARDRTTVRKIYYYAVAPFTPIFAREMRCLLTQRRLRPSVVHAVLLATSRTLHISHSLRQLVRHRGQIEVAYCYWNGVQAYAAVLRKRRGDIRKVATRVHGGDLYEELRPGEYMPLKRQFVEEMDLIAPISAQGRDYFLRQYRATASRVVLSRLGVNVPEATSRCSPPGHLSIASVSLCSAGKQVAKIIDAVAVVARAEPQTTVTWTHIGDGPLFSELNSQAQRVFQMLPNVRFRLAGRLSNRHVLAFYLQSPVDIFVNASRSEGVPVSIMEAMSCGIPAIAPDVGGVKELVNGETGVLMTSSPSAAEIGQNILQYRTKAKSDVSRAAARSMVTGRFDATKNYALFLRAIDDLVSR